MSRSHEDGAKSRKDLIDQLIAESKKRKAEQQKLREQTLDLTEKLDTEWKDLLPVISGGPKASDVEKPKPDSYDTLMRELKFEARGKVLHSKNSFLLCPFVVVTNISFPVTNNSFTCKFFEAIR